MTSLLLLPALLPTRQTPAPQAAPALKVKQGDLAPDFTLDGTDGKAVRLSDLRGKVVILDFWAPWCGWCQAAMPGLERLSSRVKSQNVVVLSPCVFDDRVPYDAWIKANAGSKYTFTFGYDPAGKDKPRSFAKTKYGLYALPTTFVVDRTGRIAEVLVGYSPDERKLEAALGKLGVKVAAE